MTTNMTIDHKELQDYTYSSTRRTGDKLNTVDHFHKGSTPGHMTTNMTIDHKELQDYMYSSTRRTGDKLNTMDHFHKGLQDT